MKQGAVSLLHRLLLRWPLLLALAFTVYSAALLTYAFGSWQRMRQDANSFLVADNLRRAMTLADLAGDIRNTAVAHADIHEMRAYLSNRDLGMSPRYGLNAGLAAIDARFQQLAEQAGQRWAIATPRIVYYATDGSVLADSAPDAPSGFPVPALTAETRLTLVPERGAIIVAAPVMHKGQPDGMVVTAMPVAALFRNLLATDSSGGYRELLLTADGTQLREGERHIALDARQRRLLAGLADNTVLPAAQTLGAAFNGGSADEVFLVKTTVPGVPLVLVTFVPEQMAYGHLVSRRVLLAASLLLVLLLLGALKLERMRERAAELEAGIASAERERALAEFRNVELSVEILRRQVVEQALAESRERWELAVAGTNDGIWDWNIRSGEVFFSGRWTSMLGYAESDIGGRIEEWSGLLHPEDIERVLAEVDRHLRGETEFFLCPQRLRCKDGGYKWILARGRALFDAAGKPLRMSGSHTDITEQRAAEAHIVDRNEQLNAIFDLSPDGFVAFDPERRVKYANPAFLQMTGYAEKDIVGLDEAGFSARLARDCMAGTGFPGVAAMRRIKEAEIGKEAAELPPRPRLLIELGDARKRVLELKLRLAQAATVSAILYLRDITHEVEVERVKSEFLSHAAHELRTPMASIYGFSELLMTQEFDEATRQDLLATIHKQTEWLVAIINELLDLARIEERRGQDLRMENVLLAPLLDEVATALLIDPERWPLAIEPADDLLSVRADAPASCTRR